MDLKHYKKKRKPMKNKLMKIWEKIKETAKRIDVNFKEVAGYETPLIFLASVLGILFSSTAFFYLVGFIVIVGTL